MLTSLISLAFLLSSSLALDYQPPFLTPEGGEVWVAGSNHSCSWNQTFPEGISSNEVAQTAKFLLRYKKSGDVSDYGNTTLAEDIPLYPPFPDTLNFTLPTDLEAHSTYFLILLGSTSDESPQFTIVPKIVPTPVGPAHLPFPSSDLAAGPVVLSSATTASMAVRTTTTGSGIKGMGMGGQGRNGKGSGGSGSGDTYLEEILKAL